MFEIRHCHYCSVDPHAKILLYFRLGLGFKSECGTAQLRLSLFSCYSRYCDWRGWSRQYFVFMELIDLDLNDNILASPALWAGACKKWEPISFLPGLNPKLQVLNPVCVSLFCPCWTKYWKSYLTFPVSQTKYLPQGNTMQYGWVIISASKISEINQNFQNKNKVIPCRTINLCLILSGCLFLIYLFGTLILDRTEWGGAILLLGESYLLGSLTENCNFSVT